MCLCVRVDGWVDVGAFARVVGVGCVAVDMKDLGERMLI